MSLRIKPENVMRVCLATAIAAVVGTGAIALQRPSERRSPLESKDCRAGRVATATTYCVAALGWPLAWSLVLGLGDRCSFMALALAWGSVLTTWDLVAYAQAAPGEWLSSPEEQRLQVQGTALVSTAFAIGAILAGSINRKVANAAAPAVLLSLSLCVAFVIPTVRSPRSPIVACAVRCAQRSALTYSQGFVLAGLTMAYQHTAPLSLRLYEWLDEAAIDVKGVASNTAAATAAATATAAQSYHP